METIPLEWTPEPDARLRGEEIEETLTRWNRIARAFNEERRSMADVTEMRHDDKREMYDIAPDEVDGISIDEDGIFPHILLEAMALGDPERYAKIELSSSEPLAEKK